MKTIFVLNGVVVGKGTAFSGSVAITHDDTEAITYQVDESTAVEIGWVCTSVNGAPIFTEPAPVPPKVGPIAFQMLFTADEAEAAASLKANDGKLASFWKLIDDPRTDVVDLSLQTVQGAVEYTLMAVKASGVDVDVPTRKAQILTGIVQ